MTENGQSNGLAAELADSVEREASAVQRSLEQELERLRHEALERARELGGAAAALGGAAGLGIVAAGALAFVPLIALRRWVPPTLIAGGVVFAAGFGAAALGRRGFSSLRRAAPAAVEETLDEASAELRRTLRDRAAGAVGDLVP